MLWLIWLLLLLCIHVKDGGSIIHAHPVCYDVGIPRVLRLVCSNRSLVVSCGYRFSAFIGGTAAMLRHHVQQKTYI